MKELIGFNARADTVCENDNKIETVCNFKCYDPNS